MVGYFFFFALFSAKRVEFIYIYIKLNKERKKQINKQTKKQTNKATKEKNLNKDQITKKLENLNTK